MKLVYNSLLEFENATSGAFGIYIEDDIITTEPSIEACVKYITWFIDDKFENLENVSFWSKATFGVRQGNQLVGHIVPIVMGSGKYEFKPVDELLAPNGNKSLLCRELYQLVRTNEFKAWFGDWENNPEASSKVVDVNGEPLVVYHGTKAEFSEFDSSASRNSGIKEQWFCFTDNENMANYYANYDGSQGTIMKIFLNIRDMPVIDGGFKNWRLATMDFGYKEGNIHDIKDAFFNGNRSAGISEKDGFCVKNTLEVDCYSDEDTYKYEDMFGTTFYVRNPNQIKSIDSRSFSSTNNNIYEDLLEM